MMRNQTVGMMLLRFLIGLPAALPLAFVACALRAFKLIRAADTVDRLGDWFAGVE